MDLVLAHGFVVTMDADYRVFPDGAVAVRGDSIVAVGPTEAVRTAHPDLPVFDCGGRTVVPGLVNAHTHAPMTLLRGLADDRRLDVWLMGYMLPVEREFVSPDFCRLGTRIACAEMIRGGTTCFADMYYFEDAVAETAAEAGLRAVCAQTVLKFPSPDAPSFEDALASARDLVLRWKGHPLITPSVAPHAPYTCTPEILEACTLLAVEHQVPLQIHVAETSQEVEEWRAVHDMPVVPWLKKQSLLEAKVLAAHCVHVDEGEIRTLLHAGAGVAHNPSSNLKLASGIAPVAAMLQAGLSVGVGTDGAAANNNLDLFHEIRLAALLAKAATSDPTRLPARSALAMATRWGAQALHLGGLIGSLEPGKRADLVLVDLEAIHAVPHFLDDPDSVYSRLVYAAKANDVTDVMVNGRWLMRARSLLTLEEDSLRPAAQGYAARIERFLAEREDSVLSKLVAIEGAQQEESYEVQIKVRLSGAPPSLESSPELEVLRTAHYLEFDTYFTFSDPSQGRLRYREDQFVDDAGNVHNVRYRLTLTGPAAERRDRNSVFLSRSRFIAPATHSARFYREYFKPIAETNVQKDRRRWAVRFRGREFFVHLDRVLDPPMKDAFLEVKSRTWSRRDAEQKAELILALLALLGADGEEAVTEEYPDLVGRKEAEGPAEPPSSAGS